MDTLRFTLETITPLFMHGPDGDTPELRPPSFKGVLRYWWRALKVLSLDKLQQQEGNLFGSAGGDEGGRQSTVKLRVRHDGLTYDRYRPLPRKHFRFKGFDPGQRFDLIAHVTPRCKLSADAIRDIFTAGLLLGGFGGRSRRGFGALRIVSINGESPPYPEDDPLQAIAQTMRRVNDDFARDGSAISYAGSNQPRYPWVRSVRVGKPYENGHTLIETIDRAAHENNSQLTGNAMGQRFASPEYVTAWYDGSWYQPIVTSLHVPEQTKNKLRGRDTRDAFKDAVLR